MSVEYKKCKLKYISLCTIFILHRFNCRDPSMTSEVYHYKRGSNQQFIQPLHVFDPSLYSAEDLSYMFNKEIIPIAIHCVAHDTSEGKLIIYIYF